MRDDLIKKPLTLGIIGGMGPEATVDLMQRIIKQTPAADDHEHLRMLVDNNTRIPSRIAALIEGHGESPAPEMIRTAQGLEKAGAELLLMPCNTAHHYYDAVSASVSVPMINMIECVVQTVVKQQPHTQKVGVLGSSALHITALYQPYFAAQGIEVCYPSAERQSQVMALIKAVKSNALEPVQLEHYNAAAQAMADEHGVDSLVVACTELSVIDQHLHTALPVVDALDVLALTAVEKALNPTEEPVGA